MIQIVNENGRRRVKLDGRFVGEILPVQGGYQYFPKGEKTGGEIYPTVIAVRNSLVEEADNGLA